MCIKQNKCFSVHMYRLLLTSLRLIYSTSRYLFFLSLNWYSISEGARKETVMLNYIVITLLRKRTFICTSSLSGPRDRSGLGTDKLLYSSIVYGRYVGFFSLLSDTLRSRCALGETVFGRILRFNISQDRPVRVTRAAWPSIKRR